MKCLVFCDLSHEIYLQLLAKYPSPELKIIRAYACDGPFKTSATIDLHPLNDITEKQSFDAAIIFHSDVSAIVKLLSKIYENNAAYSILDYNSFSQKCLSGAGQLELLRLDLIHNCPSSLNLEMGDFSYYESLDIRDEIQDGNVKVIVGKFCSIGPNVTFMLAVEHKTNWLTSYPFYRLLGYETANTSSVSTKGNIIIGNDVWIGANATIMSGVKIADGCVIGSNAVVAKSTEPYSIIVGNPGKVIKKRFSQETIDKLIEMKWWNWDYQKIYDSLPFLQSEDTSTLFTLANQHDSKSI